MPENKDGVAALKARIAELEKLADQRYADSMIGHRWMGRVFGEQMNGRDFKDKCPWADELLAARDARMKADGAAEWLVTAHRNAFSCGVKTFVADLPWLLEEAERLRGR